MGNKCKRKPLQYPIDVRIFPEIGIVAAHYKLKKQEWVERALLKQINCDKIRLGLLGDAVDFDEDEFMREEDED